MGTVEKKKETLKKTVKRFKELQKPTSQDYYELMVTVVRVTRPDAGLVWSEIKEILVQEIDDE